MKGKFPTRAKKGKRTRKQDVLELIHINVSGLISPIAIRRFRYFITFINDHSKIKWVDLLIEKSKPLENFNRFKEVIKPKLVKKIKCVNSNKGEEYYERYDESRRNLDPFAKYCKNV